MKDEDKTKEQLIIELKQLRQRITEFEKSETEPKRAELVKGRLDIQSQRGKGTRVTAYLPLSPKGRTV